MTKEFLYIGHYIAKGGEYILKIGTTNDLKRRTGEHNRNYKKTPNFPMAEGTSYVMDWSLPLSKYNTLRFEESNKPYLTEQNIGTFLEKDRFVCAEKPDKIFIKIRKTYEISLQ